MSVMKRTLKKRTEEHKKNLSKALQSRSPEAKREHYAKIAEKTKLQWAKRREEKEELERLRAQV